MNAKGIGFARYVAALARGEGEITSSLEIAKAQPAWRSTPEVEATLRAAVAAGTTTDATWAAPLAPYNAMTQEFIEVLRPQTIIGRITNFRRVPFNVRMARQTLGLGAGWVGGGQPKVVGAAAFDSVTLGIAKVAGLCVVTKELIRNSTPSAEAVLLAELTKACAQFIDQAFIDPAAAAVTDVSPASVTNGATEVASTGSTLAQIETDARAILQSFADADVPLDGATWVMHPRTALHLAMLRDSTGAGAAAFPTMTPKGGIWFGLPVLTSRNCPLDTNQEGIIALVAPDEVALADDGLTILSVAQHASLQMDSAPSAGAATHVSLWQNNLVGLRAERYVNWSKRHDACAAYISGVSY